MSVLQVLDRDHVGIRIVIAAKRAAMKPSRDLSHVRCVPRRCDELPAHAC